MNKKIKLIKHKTITEYTCNFDEQDFAKLLLYDGLQSLHNYLHELYEEFLYLRFDLENHCLDIWLDSDLVDYSDTVRENIETSIGKYFKLAATYEHG